MYVNLSKVTNGKYKLKELYSKEGLVSVKRHGNYSVNYARLTATGLYI